MDERIQEIRSQLENAKFYGSPSAKRDIRWLLGWVSQLRKESREQKAKPTPEPVEADMLEHMRSMVDSGKYPNPRDILALIESVENSRAQHVRDLEEIITMSCNATSTGTLGRIVERVQRKLDKIRRIDDYDRIDKIFLIWQATRVVSTQDMEFLIEYARKFQGERDPDERRADFGKLRDRLYEVAGISKDIHMSYFDLVEAIDKKLGAPDD